MVFDVFKIRSSPQPSTDTEHYTKTLRGRLNELGALSTTDPTSKSLSLSARRHHRRSTSSSAHSTYSGSNSYGSMSRQPSGASTPPRVGHSAAAYNYYYANRSKFPADQLRPYIKALLTAMLNGVQWDNDRARMGALSKEICERIKQRMIEIEGKGFKYIVNTTFSENLGQAGRADMSCHWEDTDAAVQEMFSNDTMIVVCLAYAVRV